MLTIAPSKIAIELSAKGLKIRHDVFGRGCGTSLIP